MATQISIRVGDTSPDLVATLMNAAGAQNLTNASVTATMTLVQQSALSASVKKTVTLACTVDAPATAGVVRHVWAAGETDTPGIYKLEYTVTYFNGQVQTFPNEDTVLIQIA